MSKYSLYSTRKVFLKKLSQCAQQASQICKVSLKGGLFGEKKNFRKKSRTMPKKI